MFVKSRKDWTLESFGIKEMGDLTGNEVAMSNKSVLFLAVSLYFWVNFFLSDRRVRG